ncbi:MAG: DEAD/DEAH box helicase [bacterium]|nr:DEAD/DEAH box helicase [bacterium]MCM1376157.1 DEAD/DEAH box helicase [Muribaculum sp.]
MSEIQQTIHFLFTEDGFHIDDRDETLSESALKWKHQFEEEPFAALYQLGFVEKPAELDVAGNFLYRLADAFFHMLTTQPDLELTRENAVVRPDEIMTERLLSGVPFTLGSEHITSEWLTHIFVELNDIYARELQAYDGTVAMYLAEKSQHLKVPERIFFHLVESKDIDYPFAFLATYATRDAEDKVRHVPLQYALTEYKKDRSKLLELLSCLNQVAEVSDIIGEFVEKGEMFHPLRLTSKEAYRILLDIPAIEKAGIVCRIPNWWRKNAYNVNMSINLGEEKPTYVGADALLSMCPQLTVDGVALSQKEIQDLLAQTEGLALLKGKWIEVNHQKLKRLLDEMQQYEGEVTLLEALRMGLGNAKDERDADVGKLLTNGKWLSGLLQNLRSPGKIRSTAVPRSFQAQLRPYQQTGFTWLNYMNKLGFGACLADDMGLGKTVQVLAFLEKLRLADKKAHALLIVPASLLGNWQKEAARFAPKMSVHILHGRGAKAMGEEVASCPSFLMITTYGMAARIKELEKVTWDCLILDEAQAIKNPLTDQTRQIKKLKSRMKIAMTGTPIENELTNLWSLFDFLDKGLLGSSTEFKRFCKDLSQYPEGYAKLKNMISPFMLRRVKTDKSIIHDLPDKLEQIDYVSISRKQTVLYRQQVDQLAQKLAEAQPGIERRGLVLAALTKLKQICNHPDQYLGQQAYSAKDSGKFELLRSLCETIYEKRERVLIFTQFKEITPYLDDYLAEIFHARGFVLHGGTPVKTRTRIVESFQGEKYVPYIILSVRAGGTGLNLTKASHVIHFDRWWNPAVENQATDRAYRIGQKNNVMVHKLVCKGTIEEKIDEMITAKTELAQNVIGSGGENWITEMSDEQLLSIMRLE